MKKTLTITLPLIAFLLILLVSSAHAGSRRFRAQLSGSEEVPPVITIRTGEAQFKLNEEGTELAYKLSVSDTTDVTQAHIHVGARGENGDIILFLARSADDFDEDGVVEGVLTEDDLIPRPDSGIETFEDAIEAMSDGNTYANVHTKQNPGGEIRGQIEPEE